MGHALDTQGIFEGLQRFPLQIDITEVIIDEAAVAICLINRRVLGRCRDRLDAGAAGRTTWPRSCGTVRASNGRSCLPGRKSGGCPQPDQQAKDSDPKCPVHGCQQRALPVSAETLRFAFVVLVLDGKGLDVREEQWDK